MYFPRKIHSGAPALLYYYGVPSLLYGGPKRMEKILASGKAFLPAVWTYRVVVCRSREMWFQCSLSWWYRRRAVEQGEGLFASGKHLGVYKGAWDLSSWRRNLRNNSDIQERRWWSIIRYHDWQSIPCTTLLLLDVQSRYRRVFCPLPSLASMLRYVLLYPHIPVSPTPWSEALARH